jgi:hypothetical protein
VFPFAETCQLFSQKNAINKKFNDSAVVQLIALKQNTAVWFLLYTFSFTSSTSSHLLEELKNGSGN